MPAAFVLLLVPGLTFLSLLKPEDRKRLFADEAVFLTGGISVAASSWVALALAEFGRFGTVRAAALVLVAALLCLIAARFAGVMLRFPLLDVTPVSAWPVALVAIVSFALHARPSEYIVGGRDPGAYIAAMGVIARTGAITHHDAVVASIPPQDLGLFYANLDDPPFVFSLAVDDERPQPSWPRFMGFELDHPRSGAVTPQFFHLFPAFGAYLFETMGVRGALATPPVFGTLGTLAAFFLGRRLFGAAAALGGALALATSVLQVWFARYPVSEGFSQFLILSGLLALWLDQQAASRAFAWLGGALLGLTLLVRIDSVLLVIPVALWILVLVLGRTGSDWKGRALGLATPFALLALHGALHAVFFARRYAHQILTRRYWNHPPWLWIAAVAMALVVIALLWKHGPRLMAAIARRDRQWRLALVAILSVTALYAITLRPSLSAWAGGDGNAKEERLQDPEVLQSLGFHRLAAHDAQALRRFGWFVGAPALSLGLVGLGLFILRTDARGLAAMSVVLAFSLFYFYKIRVFNDYFFAMRRYVPVTLPFTFLLGAWLLVVLARDLKRGRVIAGALGLVALAPSLANTRPIVSYVDWRGSVRFVQDVARRFGPRDVVLFEQPKSIHLLSLPLWGLYGTNALEFRRFNPDPARLSHLIASWRDTYRNIYLVTSYRTDVCGLFLERAQAFRFTSHEFEWTYDRVPIRPEPRMVEFALSRVVEPEAMRVSPERVIDIGGSGDAQVSGFFERESTGERSYRWTGACLDGVGNATGSIYVPAVDAHTRLRIRATAHLRPASAKPAHVRAFFNDLAIGEFDADATWRDFEVVVPHPMPPGRGILRLDVPAWRPSNTDPASTDTRDLGILIDSIEVVRKGGMK